MRRIALVALLATALGLGWKALPGTPAIAGPDPIAVLEPVQIGGMTQWLLIRGQDRSAPVLLWLHVGPGAAQMPLAHATTRALEQFLQDAHAVTRHLQARLGAERILLLGHSWGTMLGARLVARWPEDYAGDIGAAKQVSTARGVAVTLDRLGPRIRERGRAGALRWLE